MSLATKPQATFQIYSFLKKNPILFSVLQWEFVVYAANKLYPFKLQSLIQKRLLPVDMACCGGDIQKVAP